MASGDDNDAMVIGRPQNVAFKPVRVFIKPGDGDERDWVINDIQVVHLVAEQLLKEAYADRRKAGRKIRQQRRKIRRLNAGTYEHPGDDAEFARSVPASVAGGGRLPRRLPR